MRSQSTNGGLEADLTLDITATDTNGSGGGGSGGGGSLKATNDSYTATSGQPLRVSTPGVLANDSGSQLTVLNHGIASHGSLTVSTNGSFTYTPAAGYTGTDSFTYTVKDSGSQTATGTVFINVRGGGGGGNGGGGAPIAFSDSYTVIGGQSLKIANPASGVLSNDLGRSGSQIFAVLDSYGASHGLVSLNLDGTFTYTPYADFVGADSFTYRASYVASFHMASELSEASQPTLVTIFVTRPPIPHFIGLWNPIHSRKKLTQITVAFDQALDEVSAEQSVHYILRLATKKRRRTVYLKSVRVRSVVYDPSNHTVILSLKKPTKGRFELTILSGILGVTGYATQESTVVYVS